MVDVPRFVVDEPLSAHCDSIVDLISEVITECPPELAGDIVQRGIVLIGGGANVSVLGRQLEGRLEAPVVISSEPETCVIRGLMKTDMSTRRSLGSGWTWRSLVSNGQRRVRDPHENITVSG